MISNIRTYFQARIAEVFPDLEEWDGLTDENIPETIIAQRYKLDVNQTSSTLINSDFSNVTNVTIDIYVDGYNEPKDQFYVLYDGALELQVCIADLKQYNQLNIKSVVMNSITPDLNPGAENIIKLTMDFTVQFYLKGF